MENLENLETIYQTLSSKNEKVPLDILDKLKVIGENCYKRKGIYTVLLTLLYYKYLHPEQDIRLFQKHFKNGFSARSFDTKNVTPVLQRLGLPAMAESGWLTRSLEQPYPYDYNYKGKIPKHLKEPFLDIIHYIETTNNTAYPCLINLLKIVQKEAMKNQIKIEPLSEKELSIEEIINILEEHFLFNYSTHGAAKLPVLSFYSLYHFIINEIGRYNQCSLADLSSLTACDKTNKASGDIEIFKNESIFESIEIKLDRKIDAHILRIVKQKIYKWNPQRYYILSVYGVKDEDIDDMYYIVNDVKNNHGCQIIINGLIATMKYYLRLVNNLVDFVNYYSYLVEIDKEINIEHKQKWNELLRKLNKDK